MQTISGNAGGQCSEFAGCPGEDSDGPIAEAAWRERFRRLRARLDLHPDAGRAPSAAFEAAARTVRGLAAECLPLAVAVTMHLYPLCALQWVPIPLLSSARIQRARLLHQIRSRSWILANAGSDRVEGAHAPLIATAGEDGLRIDGCCEYMSLASVADIALFKAQLANSAEAVLCAADLRGESVRIGPRKFTGSMRLSDTACVSFIGHRVAHDRYVRVPQEATLGWISDYQRCWFHLMLVEAHLARLDRLHEVWRIPRTIELLVSLNELSRLRAYSLRLLDEFPARRDLESLTGTTAAMKLRASLLAQSMGVALREFATHHACDGQRLEEHARELGYIRSQPIADGQILRRLGVLSPQRGCG